MQQYEDFVIDFRFTGVMRNREDCVLKVGIIGNNPQGKALQQLQCASIDIYLYDPNPEYCEPSDTTISVLERCDIVFNCIVTSVDHHSYYHMDNLLHATTLLHHPYQIIYGSTPIGFSDSNGCGFMPTCDVKHANYWIFGLPANHTEECKHRLTTLITICHVEGSIQSSMIYWLTAAEAELLHLSRHAIRMSYAETCQSLSDLAMVKGLSFDNVKLLLDMDPNIYKSSISTNDMHLLYGQFQKAGIESHYIETIVSREKTPIEVAVPTTKMISLVIASTNDKLTEDVCRNLVKKDNLVILFAPTTTLLLDEDGNVLQNVIAKTGTFLTKQFFPRLDYIWDFSKMDTCKTCNTSAYSVLSAAMVETMNKLELVKQHHCSLTFLTDHDENDILVQAFVTEYPEHKHKVEMIHILFDKNERSDYILH